MPAELISHHPLKYYETPSRYYVWKPSGIASVPGTRVSVYDCLRYSGQEKKDPQTFLNRTLPEGGLVMRLDVCTSGLLLFAKNRVVYETYHHRQNQYLIAKIYYATVYGRLTCTHGVIGCFLAQHRDDPIRVLAQTNHNHNQGKKRYWTETLYTLCEYDDTTKTSIVRCIIHRGFRHQIRYHLMMMGHPVVGDTLYIPGSHSAYTKHGEPNAINLCCVGYTNLPDDIP